MRKKRIKWRDRTLENDIKYGGVLSYRHIRIIGWVCMVIAQVALVLTLDTRISPQSAATLGPWINVLSFFSALPLPLFMLANFSIILQGKGAYKSLLIRFGAMAVGMYLLGNFIVLHYGYRAMRAFGPITYKDAADFFGILLPALGKTGYMLNLFIDMILCVMLFFFANYTPEKHFQGKKIYLFRALIALPIAYEVAGFVIKCLIYFGSIDGGFDIPSFVFFLLPSKPPLLFLAFVIIVICLKLSEKLYLRREGHTHETYAEYVKTKAHSLRTSVLIATTFLIAAVLDLIALIVVSVLSVGQTAFIDAATMTEEEMQLAILHAQYLLTAFLNAGIGGAVSLFVVAPLVMLFSYTKKHKNPKIDTLIPVAGIALIAVVYIEGIFQVLTLNLGNVISKIEEAATEEQSAEASASIVQYAKAVLNSLPHLFQ